MWTPWIICNEITPSLTRETRKTKSTSSFQTLSWRMDEKVATMKNCSVQKVALKLIFHQHDWKELPHTPGKKLPREIREIPSGFHDCVIKWSFISTRNLAIAPLDLTRSLGNTRNPVKYLYRGYTRTSDKAPKRAGRIPGHSKVPEKLRYMIISVVAKHPCRVTGSS